MSSQTLYYYVYWWCPPLGPWIYVGKYSSEEKAEKYIKDRSGEYKIKRSSPEAEGHLGSKRVKRSSKKKSRKRKKRSSPKKKRSSKKKRTPKKKSLNTKK